MIKRRETKIKTYPIIKEKGANLPKLNFVTKVGISLIITFSLTVLIGGQLYANLNSLENADAEVLSENVSTEQITSIEPELTQSDACTQELEENNLNSLFWWNDAYKYKQKISVNLNGDIDNEKFIRTSFNHKSIVNDGKSNQDGRDLKVVELHNGRFQVVPFRVDGINSSSSTIYFLPRNINSGAQYYLYYSKINGESMPRVNDQSENDQSLYSAILEGERPYPLSININREFILKGYNDLELTINIDDSIRENLSAINYEIPGTDISSAIITEEDDYATTVNLEELNSGDYEIIATVYDECYTLRSSSKSFKISYPLFVTWTLDWEGYDVYDRYLDQMTDLSSRYSVPMTQLFNPRIYVTSSITAARKQKLTNWAKDRQQKGDEIGLHLHMWSDMIRNAGVTPKTYPNWDEMGTGYDVLFSAYNESESIKILNWAKEEMKSNGFEDLTSFRAGGWAIDEENMKALEKTGFKVDSSGRTKHNLGPKLIPSNWNLTAETKPYHPSVEDITRSGELNFTLWEFPNNGADSYQYSYEQMRERFDANYSDQMNSPQVVTYLSHPHWFNIDYPKLDALFNYIDSKSYDKGRGVVVFATLEEVYEYWEENDLR